MTISCRRSFFLFSFAPTFKCPIPSRLRLFPFSYRFRSVVCLTPSSVVLNMIISSGSTTTSSSLTWRNNSVSSQWPGPRTNQLKSHQHNEQKTTTAAVVGRGKSRWSVDRIPMRWGKYDHLRNCCLLGHQGRHKASMGIFSTSMTNDYHQRWMIINEIHRSVR